MDQLGEGRRIPQVFSTRRFTCSSMIEFNSLVDVRSRIQGELDVNCR